jgi:hypothetical protein
MGPSGAAVKAIADVGLKVKKRPGPVGRDDRPGLGGSR